MKAMAAIPMLESITAARCSLVNRIEPAECVCVCQIPAQKAVERLTIEVVCPFRVSFLSRDVED